jgi:hypothetical protein
MNKHVRLMKEKIRMRKTHQALAANIYVNYAIKKWINPITIAILLKANGVNHIKLLDTSIAIKESQISKSAKRTLI